MAANPYGIKITNGTLIKVTDEYIKSQNGHLNIPNTVTTIGNSACSLLTSLRSVTISDSVTLIKVNALRNCTNLQSITIPCSVQWIEYYAFQYCTSLQSVTISDSLQWIEDHVFEGCTNLNEIIITLSDPYSYERAERLKSILPKELQDKVVFFSPGLDIKGDSPGFFSQSDTSSGSHPEPSTSKGLGLG